MRFHYKEVKWWPFLAWLAKMSDTREIYVLHGSEVETNENFFCEAVWDGDFTQGDFDKTEIVFGSGARKRENRITFVTSCATLDRLQHCITQDNTIVISNSLVCLLSYLDEKLDPTYKNYYLDFLSIAEGINKYKKVMRTLNDSEINLTYYQNLEWDGSRLSLSDKAQKKKGFISFDGYYNFLCASLEKIFKNASDGNRKFKLKKLGTISKGYDSPAVTAMAKTCGLDSVIALDQDRAGNNDCGEDIARALDLQVTKVLRDAWKSSKLSEVPFVAAEGRGEDVQFFGIPDRLLQRSIFLTGYYGDKVWTKRSKQYKYSDELIRSSSAGLSLTEFRLWKSFIHVPVPFVGARQVQDINKVSNLEEMQGWNVPSQYNRPICRRIVEACGVPRDAFGQKKQVTTVELSNRWTFITENSQIEFYVWLQKQRNIFRQKGKVFPSKKVRFIANSAKRILLRSIHLATLFFDYFSLNSNKLKYSLFYRQLKYDYWFNFLYPWAIECAKAKYRQSDKLQDKSSSVTVKNLHNSR